MHFWIVDETDLIERRCDTAQRSVAIVRGRERKGGHDILAATVSSPHLKLASLHQLTCTCNFFPLMLQTRTIHHEENAAESAGEDST